MSAIDFDTTLLPDTMTLPLLWVGLLLSVVGTDPTIGLPVDMQSSIIGAVAEYLSLWSVYHLFKLLTGKEGWATATSSYSARSAPGSVAIAAADYFAVRFHGRGRGNHADRRARPRSQHPDSLRSLSRGCRLDRANVGG